MREKYLGTDYSISTRIDNFQCHRVVTTTRGTGPKAEWHEDKVTFTDPIIYFFRDKSGWGQPGAFAKRERESLCIMCDIFYISM